ncbi:hypothetical protein ES703_116507 [subsurface metagenome]
MSPIDTDEGILSEDTAGHTNSDVDNLKLVPVAESIRYRKRAQSAEKKIEALAEQLREAKSEAKKMAEQLSSIEVEQKLTRKLAAAGTVDVETAVLIAKARIEGQDDADLDGVVKQLKREKQHLFAGNSDGAVTAKKTAGVKDRMQNSQTILERAARKAATTGNRTDLQEYLKLRRNFI